MKKLLLTIGTIVTIVAPVSVSISCGNSKIIHSQIEVPAQEPRIITPALETNIQTPTQEPKITTPALETNIQTPTQEPRIITPALETDIQTPSQEPKITTPVPEIKQQPQVKNPTSSTPTLKSKTTILLPSQKVQSTQNTVNNIVPKGFEILNNNIFILDADDKPTDTKDDLMLAYGKFTKEINFSSSNTGAFGSLGSLNKVTEVDKSKKYIKVMFVGTQNNGNKIYYCGVMGYKPGSTALYFLWRQFDKISGISDTASKGTFNDLRMNPLATDSSPEFKLMASMKQIPQMVNYLIKVAKREFPSAVVTLKP